MSPKPTLNSTPSDLKKMSPSQLDIYDRVLEAHNKSMEATLNLESRPSFIAAATPTAPSPAKASSGSSSVTLMKVVIGYLAVCSLAFAAGVGAFSPPPPPSPPPPRKKFVGLF